jgi:hypothetical protein
MDQDQHGPTGESRNERCERQGSASTSGSVSNYARAYRALYGRPEEKPGLRRDRLPEPLDYYTRHLHRLRMRGDWASARCPFHQDKNPSLSVSLTHGGYLCHACGARGGDLLDFHQRLRGISFREAAKDLNAWEGP